MLRPQLARCTLLVLGLLLAAIPFSFGPALVPAARAQSANPVVIENQQPGSDQWRLKRPGFHLSNDAAGQIKGYASATSVNKGQNITFYITVNPVQTYTIDIYRVGWYGGAGGRLHQHVGPVEGVRQPACPVDSTTGLTACNWAPSYTLAVPDTWTSGV